MNNRIKILIPSLLIFFIFSLSCFFITDRNLYIYTSDFFQYHGHAHKILGNLTSGLSNELYLSDGSSNNLSPSPFYALVFLLPITIFGSKEIFFFEGLFIGILIIYNFELLLSKINYSFDFKFKSLILVITTCFPSFILETITVSNMAVAILFIFSAFNVKNRFYRIILLCLAALVRANYIVAFLSLIIALLIFNPKGKSQLLMDLIPSIGIYIVNYKFYYSHYPGSGFNYLLTPLVPYISKFSEYSENLFRDFLIQKNVVGLSMEDWSANPLEVIKLIFSTQEIFSYTVNLIFVKISLTLGFLYDFLLDSGSGFWLIKPFRTIYFAFFTLPGAYCTFLALFIKSFTSIEKTLFSWSLIFLVLNSILVATPKYFIGTHFIVVYALFSFIHKILELNIDKKNLINN